jgi:hypothetical protein
METLAVKVWPDEHVEPEYVPYGSKEGDGEFQCEQGKNNKEQSNR